MENVHHQLNVSVLLIYRHFPTTLHQMHDEDVLDAQWLLPSLASNKKTFVLEPQTGTLHFILSNLCLSAVRAVNQFPHGIRRDIKRCGFLSTFPSECLY